MGMTDTEARQVLLARRDALLQSRKETEADRRPVELDQASVGRLSRMDALQMQAMADASERRRGLELQRIDAALARLENGSFGDCVKCGNEIAHKRLQLDPSTAYCIDCAG